MQVITKKEQAKDACDDKNFIKLRLYDSESLLKNKDNYFAISKISRILYIWPILLHLYNGLCIILCSEIIFRKRMLISKQSTFAIFSAKTARAEAFGNFEQTTSL